MALAAHGAALVLVRVVRPHSADPVGAQNVELRRIVVHVAVRARDAFGVGVQHVVHRTRPGRIAHLLHFGMDERRLAGEALGLRLVHAHAAVVGDGVQGIRMAAGLGEEVGVAIALAERDHLGIVLVVVVVVLALGPLVRLVADERVVLVGILVGPGLGLDDAELVGFGNGRRRSGDRPLHRGAAGGGGFCCLGCVVLGRASYDADDEAQSCGDGDDDGRLLPPLRAKHNESSPLDSCLPASHRDDYSNV